MHSRVAANVSLVLRIILGATLIFAGLTKLSRPYDFLENVHAYKLGQPKIEAVIGLCLPSLEMVTGAFVTAGSLRLGALALSGAMGLAFATAQTSALLRGLQIGCGCFGGSRNEIGLRSLALAIAIVVTSGYLLLVEWRGAGRNESVVRTNEAALECAAPAALSTERRS